MMSPFRFLPKVSSLWINEPLLPGFHSKSGCPHLSMCPSYSGFSYVLTLHILNSAVFVYLFSALCLSVLLPLPLLLFYCFCISLLFVRCVKIILYLPLKTSSPTPPSLL